MMDTFIIFLFSKLTILWYVSRIFLIFYCYSVSVTDLRQQRYPQSDKYLYDDYIWFSHLISRSRFTFLLYHMLFSEYAMIVCYTSWVVSDAIKFKCWKILWKNKSNLRCYQMPFYLRIISKYSRHTRIQKQVI